MSNKNIKSSVITWTELIKIITNRNFNFLQNIVLVFSLLFFIIYKDISNDSLENKEAIIFSQVIDIMSALRIHLFHRLKFYLDLCSQSLSCCL